MGHQMETQSLEEVRQSLFFVQFSLVENRAEKEDAI